MAHFEAISTLARESGGIFRTSDLTALGYNTYAIRKLINKKVITRVKPSYYQLCEASEELSEAAKIAQLFPDGVLCMDSALSYYRYSDRTRQEWTIAVDRDTSKSRFKLSAPPVQPYYMKKEYLSFGITAADYNDCTLQVFDRDRLICECIFYEHKMDRESYKNAIRSYIADPQKNVSKLLEYAEKRRILKKVTNHIKVWI